MMFKRIDHVEIVTDQLDRTAQFYTEVLGFTVKARDRIERSGLGVDPPQSSTKFIVIPLMQ
jgi:catechol 2,3-dioxygenase-like lactoylglutathione lyase family enzyme